MSPQHGTHGDGKSRAARSPGDRTIRHRAAPPRNGRSGGALSKCFSDFSHLVAHASGTPAAFLIAALTILVWAVTGPIFGYSDTWQLVINTGTTIVTFLMVFLIQSTQNRDTMALQLKLSELIIAVKGAKDSLATIEDLSEEELEQLHKELSDRMQMTSDALSDRKHAEDVGSVMRKSEPAGRRSRTSRLGVTFQTVDRLAQFFEIVRLRQDDQVPQRPKRAVERAGASARRDDDRQLRIEAAQLGHQRLARQIGQPEIDQRDVDLVLVVLGQLQRLRRGACFQNPESEFVERIHGDHGHQRLVFHQQRATIFSGVMSHRASRQEIACSRNARTASQFAENVANEVAVPSATL